GIAGKSFFQKDTPDFVPDWVRTVRIRSTTRPRDIDYVVADDVETLRYLANLGTIPIHLWASRAGSLERPDWAVLDLDPKGAPFTHVVRMAQTLRAILDEVGVPSYVKTSGKTGLHVEDRSEEHTSELQSRGHLVCRLLREKKKTVTTRK